MKWKNLLHRFRQWRRERRLLQTWRRETPLQRLLQWQLKRRCRSLVGTAEGRPRKDGLPAGSEAAREADRREDAERKRLARDRERAAQPPALPAAGGAGAAAAVVPAGQSLTIPVEAGPVPWEADSLRPIAEELVNAWEDSRVDGFRSRAKDAKLPEPLVREIAKDAAFPAAAKRGVGIGAAEVVAKWLNKSGVSAEHKPEVLLAGCLVAILAQVVLDVIHRL